jgi:predicted nucleotide-binding protein (sugar kinase/HSP70/actin superfamily)
MNREVAHFFCITLSRIRDLWNIEEVQLAFAEALRKGDTLLIDAIAFIKQYRDVPVIQEAIAFNIATCTSMLFQINVASGLGLCNHSSIKQAILDRKKDVIEKIRENWHESVCLTSTPYLIHDAEVRQVLDDARQDMIREILEEEHLVDISFLIKELEWLRHDTKIVGAIRERISDTSARFDYIFMKTLKECGMFQQYPELMDALNLHDYDTIAWILNT